MSEMRFAVLDPAAGISGDMLLGALIAAGAPADWLRGLPARLGFPEVTVDIEVVDRCGIQATKVNVRLPGGRQEMPSEVVVPGEHAREHTHPHVHDHDHHGHDVGHSHHSHSHHGHGESHMHEPHRHMAELIQVVERAELSTWVKERAIRAIRLLADAEGRVHGMKAEDVVLHEVGAVDALVDIVGGIEGFERLNIRRVHHGPVAVGSGWVRAAHGVIPVPAPATALLLEGLDIAPNGPVEGEATTPTGAVLLQVLSAGPLVGGWRPVASGWGAGGRNPSRYPNALRLMLAEPVTEAGAVVLLSTDIDDLSPEYVAPLQDALFSAGALDVQLWTTHMKKGRVGFRLEIIVAPGEVDVVTQALFRHSTTAGVRRQMVERITLPRREMTVEVGGRAVRVKVLEGPDGVKVKPEYDDVIAAAKHSGRPAGDVAQEAHEKAMRSIRGGSPSE